MAEAKHRYAFCVIVVDKWQVKEVGATYGTFTCLPSNVGDELENIGNGAMRQSQSVGASIGNGVLIPKFTMLTDLGEVGGGKTTRKVEIMNTFRVKHDNKPDMRTVVATGMFLGFFQRADSDSSEQYATVESDVGHSVLTVPSDCIRFVEAE